MARRATFQALPISALIFKLGAGLGTVTGTNRFAMGRVVDHTGLTGKYDFTLEFAGQLVPGGFTLSPSVDGATDPAPDIFQALEKQVGPILTDAWRAHSSRATLQVPRWIDNRKAA